MPKKDKLPDNFKYQLRELINPARFSGNSVEGKLFMDPQRKVEVIG
jgi:hypothetical protein